MTVKYFRGASPNTGVNDLVFYWVVKVKIHIEDLFTNVHMYSSVNVHTSNFTTNLWFFNLYQYNQCLIDLNDSK